MSLFAGRYLFSTVLMEESSFGKGLCRGLCPSPAQPHPTSAPPPHLHPEGNKSPLLSGTGTPPLRFTLGTSWGLLSSPFPTPIRLCQALTTWQDGQSRHKNNNVSSEFKQSSRALQNPVGKQEEGFFQVCIQSRPWLSPSKSPLSEGGTGIPQIPVHMTSHSSAVNCRVMLAEE